MKKILIISFALCLMFVSSIGAAEVSAPNDGDYLLRLHLTASVTVSSNNPTLGRVAALSGDNKAVEKASEISLGRISMPGQKIVINRNTVLSRLASNGFAASDVLLTGSVETVISRDHQIITGNDFVTLASEFLKEAIEGDSIHQFEVIRVPGDMIITGNEADCDVKLSCKLVRTSAGNQGRVVITVSCGRKQIGIREVVYRFKYNVRNAVTTTEIIRGQLINASNVKVEEGISSHPEPADWSVPYGKSASRNLHADTILSASMIATPKPEIVLKRNQAVVIKIDAGGLLATAMGKALQNGSVGEFIKVQNTDSKVIIVAKINKDRTVTPVF